MKPQLKNITKKWWVMENYPLTPPPPFFFSIRICLYLVKGSKQFSNRLLISLMPLLILKFKCEVAEVSRGLSHSYTHTPWPKHMSAHPTRSTAHTHIYKHTVHFDIKPSVACILFDCPSLTGWGCVCAKVCVCVCVQVSQTDSGELLQRTNSRSFGK